jgi:hypothetical protein
MPNFKTKQFTFTEHKEKGKRWKFMSEISVSISSWLPLLFKLDWIVSLQEWKANTFSATVKHMQHTDNWNVISKAYDGLFLIK